MSPLPDADGIDRFRSLIADRLGLQFDGGKEAFLAEALQRGASDLSFDTGRYLDRLAATAAASREWRALAPLLTVTETYFFRNSAQFSALREFITSAWLSSRPAPGRLRILSAGCASGEEPYSVAMLLRDLALPDCAASIQGIDINSTMLFKAAFGRYSAWSLRETPHDLRTRYFAAHGNDCVLDPEIRDSVTFMERPLNEDDPLFWRPEAFDVVFCRNVLMYFTPAAARAAIARIARSLAPGGLLFLGHAETLRGLSRDFYLCHNLGTFYYQRKDRLEPPSIVADPTGDPAWAAMPAAIDGAAGSGIAWNEMIEGAAERVRALATRPAVLGEAPPSVPRREDSLARVTALLGGEHFAEALAVLDSLAGDAAQETDAMLLRAVLLMNRGALADAERLCETLMARGDAGAGAHYLTALCREAGGDVAAAAAHDRDAVALDPDFAMPRLHLGLLARRTGERDVARRELTRALSLLPREHAARLLMFGGGFGREALLALCQAELASAGDA